MKMKLISRLLPLIGVLFFTAAKAETVPASDFLLPNGTLNVAAIGSKQLTLNLAGWHVALDAERGPVFSTDPQMLADAWSALGMGLNAQVLAMAVSGTDIYVGGTFTGVGAGGTSVPGLNCIAKWNGNTWSALGSGLNGEVKAIVLSGTNLYIGGAFTDVGAGGMAVPGLNRIAKWNGSAWSALGSGLNGPVNAIAVSNNGTDVYVGGAFSNTNLGGVSVPSLFQIAKWNGSAWSALGGGLNNEVRAIAVSGTDIYVGGNFSVALGTSVPGLNIIAKWNGTAWSALGSGLSGLGVLAIAVSGTDIYVGGNFTGTGAGGSAVPGLNNIAKWNGSTWSALGSGPSGPVYSLAVGGADVYVGGEIAFGSTSADVYYNIAKWNGSSFSGLNRGLNTIVRSIAVSGTNIYAGGNFTNVSTFTAPTSVPGLNYVAKFPSAKNITEINCKNVVVKFISSSGKTVTLEVYAPKGAAISPSLYTIKNAKVKSAPIAGGAIANTKTWILEIIDTTVEASIKSNYCPEILKLN